MVYFISEFEVLFVRNIILKLQLNAPDHKSGHFHLFLLREKDTIPKERKNTTDSPKIEHVNFKTNLDDINCLRI